MHEHVQGPANRLKDRLARRIGRALLIPLLSLAGACVSHPSPDLPVGAKAYDAIPAPAADLPAQNYLIGPLDVMDVTVFQEPDLTVRDIQVDAGGNVLLPLVGEIRASGQTTTEFAHQLERKLGERYLVNPQVSVVVSSSASQHVTVEGSVTEPGVFQIRGRTTLLDALALAKGPTRVAKLDQVIVFREIGGKRNGAVFDVPAIRAGRAPDPEIIGDDTVVVGLSNVKAAWRDFLTTVPLIAIFRPFN